MSASHRVAYLGRKPPPHVLSYPSSAALIRTATPAASETQDPATRTRVLRNRRVEERPKLVVLKLALQFEEGLQALQPCPHGWRLVTVYHCWTDISTIK